MKSKEKDGENSRITNAELRRAISIEMSMIFKERRDEIIKRAKDRLVKEKGLDEKLS